jgi:hypothetical protein
METREYFEKVVSSQFCGIARKDIMTYLNVLSMKAIRGFTPHTPWCLSMA